MQWSVWRCVGVSVAEGVARNRRLLARQQPEWVRYAILWQVFPLGFAGADTTGADRTRTGGLRALVERLDHVVELGCSGLLLGPIFLSQTHGYDTLDHFRIDERLGSDSDFDALVEACRARGLRLVLDGVFNHVGTAFDAPDEWFVWRDGVRDTFEGHAGLVRLDHTCPAVAGHVGEVMRHWLARGADGWRLDAAYAVPAAFWHAVLPQVRVASPAAYLVGEMIHGDYAGYVAESGLDAVTQYELWKSIWSSLNDGNFYELAWALQRHAGWLETFVPQTFLGNHDVTRLASRLADRRHVAHALVLLCTLAGTPSIYYGDEYGLTGVKEDRAGGDDAIRPRGDVLTDADKLDTATLRLHQDLLGMRRRHPWLHTARTNVLHLANRQLAYESHDEDTGRVRVLLNLNHEPWTYQGRTVAPHDWAVLDKLDDQLA